MKVEQVKLIYGVIGVAVGIFNIGLYLFGLHWWVNGAVGLLVIGVAGYSIITCRR